MATHQVFTLSDVSSTLVSPANATAGRDISIQNLSAGDVYIGGDASVSSVSFGYKIPKDGAWSVELNGKDEVYAIAATNGAQVAVFALGLEP